MVENVPGYLYVVFLYPSISDLDIDRLSVVPSSFAHHSLSLGRRLSLLEGSSMFFYHTLYFFPLPSCDSSIRSPDPSPSSESA